ncbi:MAG TPA: hypothetical protein VE776_15085 [Actinomycetota bacterium]|nr:hypothetical protein [Actinomycetota bacterium]
MAALGDVLRAEGMTLLTGVSAKAVRRGGDGNVMVDLSDGGTVEGERLMVATGRRSDLRALGVDARLDPRPGRRARGAEAGRRRRP